MPKNTAQTLVQLREQCSGDCLTRYNFPVHWQSCGLLLIPGKRTQ